MLAVSALVSLLPFLSLAAPTPPKAVRQSQNLLFGPFTIPSTAPRAGLQNIDFRLINFNDEVFDISSISIFGDINDGGCEESETTPEEAGTQPGRQFVLGPVGGMQASEVRNVTISLINFNDEVFDISNISVFGDVNDGACAPPA